MAYGTRGYSRRKLPIRRMAVSAIYRSTRRAWKSPFKKSCTKLVRKAENFRFLWGDKALPFAALPKIVKAPKYGWFVIQIPGKAPRFFRKNALWQMKKYVSTNRVGGLDFTVLDHEGVHQVSAWTFINQP